MLTLKLVCAAMRGWINCLLRGRGGRSHRRRTRERILRFAPEGLAEPIYRNVWSLLREFGDAELASLVLPRALVVEHSPGPAISGQKGELHTPDYASVSAEMQRIPLAPVFDGPCWCMMAREDCGPVFRDGPGCLCEALGHGATQPAFRRSAEGAPCFVRPGGPAGTFV